MAAASKTTARRRAATAEEVRQIVREVLQDELQSLLKDISYRIQVLANEAANAGRVSSHHLNLSQHILDGYTFTNNSPSAGYVSWADCHVVYKGTDYTITDGNTNKKYIYWTLTTPTQFQTSDTKPTLGPDDVLVGINDNGTFNLMMAPGKMIHGAGVVGGSISGSEIASAAIAASHILDGAVTGVKIASGAVGSTQLANGAVTSTKIANGAVGNSQLATNAVASGNIQNGAVTGSKIASGAVGSTQLADGAVTGPKIGAGAVATNKLNLATHLLY
ncbi:hypothetical protein [Thermaerobacter composti]|uniref:Uncharacterized protein n=1 Tax=Thermaerobacter composti TaxID=554949 RepID=A0ABZ0QRP8_9FIRM|nr:hypothetical protein [Thermaerobacter composti]WPD20171.1 hypothetical protein Q5761_05955 [Thermaerobacter composti]